MSPFQNLLPSFNSFRARKNVLCWTILVFLTPAISTAASASDSRCGTASKRGSLNLLDTGSGRHTRYKRKYDIDCIGERGIGKGINLYSVKRERSLGEGIAKELNAHLKFVDDPEVNAYVSGLAQKLAIHSDDPIPFVVRIVKDNDINAYSLPGGFLYINTGLILDAPDEATLAALLAHEIAHVAARHGTKILTKRYIVKMATLPLSFVGGAALMATDVAVPMLMLKFSRDTEREADLLGIEYAYSAGYDPQEFVRFFENLNLRSKQKVPFVVKMFATHPVSKDRIHRAQLEIETLLPPKSAYILDTSAFREMRQRLSILLEGPCDGANGKPVLLGPMRHCSDASESEHRPKLILRQPPKSISHTVQ
jgi:predicted Zn-dependent protease